MLQRQKMIVKNERNLHNVNCKHNLETTKPKTLTLTILIGYKSDIKRV